MLSWKLNHVSKRGLWKNALENLSHFPVRVVNADGLALLAKHSDKKFWVMYTYVQ